MRIFPGRTSRHGIEDYFRSRVWEPILRRAEIRYRKIHTLRHTFASLLIANGESLPYIQAQLGHPADPLIGKLTRLVELGRCRGNLALGKIADRASDLALLVAEIKIHDREATPMFVA